MGKMGNKKKPSFPKNRDERQTLRGTTRNSLILLSAAFRRFYAHDG